MKIKSDFVTNSSSSSFVVIGTYFKTEDIPDFIIEKIQEVTGNKELTPEYDEWDFVDEAISKSPLSFSFGCEHYKGESIMVGIEYTKMSDDETLGQFKARAKQAIKDQLGLDLEVGHIEECWEDR